MAALEQDLDAFKHLNQQEFIITVAQHSLQCHYNNKRQPPILSTMMEEKKSTRKRSRQN